VSTHPAPPLVFSVLNRRSAPAAVAPRKAVVAASPVPQMSAEDRRDFRAGIAQERRRWAKVLGSNAFGAEPVAGAHLLAQTDHTPAEIISMLRKISADAAASPAIVEAAIAARWGAAFKRVETSAASADGPRPSAQIEQRWDAAARRAGVAGPAR
jgi:hypothetical protein